jgi:hypothetical protein
MDDGIKSERSRPWTGRSDREIDFAGFGGINELMTVRPSGSRSVRTLHLVGAAAVTALFFMQVWHPVVRLASQNANEAAGFLLAMTLPWLVVVAVYRVGGEGRRWSKWAALVLAVPLVCVSVLFAFTMLLVGGAGDRHLKVIAEVPWHGTVVRAYRTDGGATTAFGVLVRQERPIVPGVLLLVRRLDGFYPCRSVEIDSTEHGARVTAVAGSSCSGFRDIPPSRVYPLREFVHF